MNLRHFSELTDSGAVEAGNNPGTFPRGVTIPRKGRKKKGTLLTKINGAAQGEG